MRSILHDREQINAFLKAEQRNAESVWVDGDRSCLLHAVLVTAPEIFRKYEITNHLQLREALCNFLSRNGKTVVSSDGQLTFFDLFNEEEGRKSFT